MGCLFELRTDFFRRSELREREHNCPAADLPKSHNVQLQQTELEMVRNWKYLQFGKDISAATIRLSTLKLKQEQNHQSKTDSTFNALSSGGSGFAFLPRKMQIKFKTANDSG
jgi:hypothetical protein